jgi:hypothetical protein
MFLVYSNPGGKAIWRGFSDRALLAPSSRLLENKKLRRKSPKALDLKSTGDAFLAGKLQLSRSLWLCSLEANSQKPAAIAAVYNPPKYD